ncbi:hypothetical protein J6590_084757 [Homalodisca vitripennis]|nr:hypothetical protein J6590_084757 [Homalodisca vitripennis]
MAKRENGVSLKKFLHSCHMQLADVREEESINWQTNGQLTDNDEVGGEERTLSVSKSITGDTRLVVVKCIEYCVDYNSGNC